MSRAALCMPALATYISSNRYQGWGRCFLGKAGFIRWRSIEIG